MGDSQKTKADLETGKSRFLPRARSKGQVQKPNVPLEKPARIDRALTNLQIEITKWFTDYKRIPFPEHLLGSNNKWWGWINAQVKQTDKDYAYAASKDFGIEVDLNNPISVIGALQYAAIADQKSKIENAKHCILSGYHPYTVAEIFLLTDDELDALVKDVEVSHPDFEIIWGSV